jgi:hypothetical protein
MCKATAELRTWAERLRRTAMMTLTPAMLSDLRGRPDGFADELGTTRPVDALLIRAVAGLGPPAGAAPMPTPDTRLWMAAIGGPAADDALAAERDGPLLQLPPRTPIEVMTESEVCALHALWTIGRRLRRPEVQDRCLRAAAWHVRELQPDNATNLPWATHVFVVLGLNTGCAEALVDAETRVHNALAGGGRGRPDLRSALIMLHASMELDLLEPTSA